MCPKDTSPEAWKVYLDIQRRMSPGEKLGRALKWSEITRQLAKAELRKLHPEAGEHEILVRFASLFLGPDLCRRVYGEVPPPELDSGDVRLAANHFVEAATRLSIVELVQHYPEHRP